MKNKGLNIFIKFIAVLVVLLILEIVLFIKILDLNPSVYISSIILINISAVYIFAWKNKKKENKKVHEIK